MAPRGKLPADSSNSALTIYHEDNHILLVEKPAGLLSQGDLSGDLDILTLAKYHIKSRDKKPGNVYIGLVHRLDRPVSGVMVLAKTSKAAGRLSLQFRERQVTKIYWAVVEGVLDAESGELRHRLKKNREMRKTMVVGPHDTGKDAVLRYRVLGAENSKSLVEIQLVTGLSHQIRAQFSAVGHPVVGDRKYNGKTPFKKGKIALHAHSLTIGHPVNKKPITATSETPEDWPWDRAVGIRNQGVQRA